MDERRNIIIGSGHVEKEKAREIKKAIDGTAERITEITDLRAPSTISRIFFSPFSPFIAPLILKHSIGN